MELYLVAVILNPTKKQQHDDGAVARIVVEPKAVLAVDANQAAMKAMQFVPVEFAGAEHVDRLEVRTLPFGRPSAK